MKTTAAGFLRGKRIKGQVYWYLVRAEWREGKPRQKVLGYVGKTKPKTIAAAQRIVRLRQQERAAIRMPVVAFYEKYGRSPAAKLRRLEAARLRFKKRGQSKRSGKSR